MSTPIIEIIAMPALGECVECGYDLRGVQELKRCPECGRACEPRMHYFISGDHRTILRVQQGVTRALFGVLLLVYAAALGVLSFFVELLKSIRHALSRGQSGEEWAARESAA